MGTPEFAVPSLRILIENEKNVVGVVTAPDKPKGRGQKVIPSPVKVYAQSQDIPVLQPTNLKDTGFIEQLRYLKADLQIVVAFRMLPRVVWNMPPKGTFNLHASLLPKYRGAAPINWAIINGEKETGITTFFLKHEIDTGNIIFQEKETIAHNDTAGSLYDRLMNKGADLVLRTTKSIEDGEGTTTPQIITEDLPNAPKLFKETCEINWDQPEYSVYNFIRGLSPYPGAWTKINDKLIKIFVTEISNTKWPSGEYETDQKTKLLIGTAGKALKIKQFQLEGKKKMTVEDYFRGNQI